MKQRGWARSRRFKSLGSDGTELTAPWPELSRLLRKFETSDCHKCRGQAPAGLARIIAYRGLSRQDPKVDLAEVHRGETGMVTGEDYGLMGLKGKSG
jgi:hypothetical protein